LNESFKILTSHRAVQLLVPNILMRQKLALIADGALLDCWAETARVA
jgi:hypothetical protein